MGKRKTGTQCCAFGCRKRKKNKLDQERSDSEGSEDEESQRKRKFPRTFHSFPYDPERRAKWVSNMYREDWSPTIYSKICSDHFVERFLNRSGLLRVEVRCNALPTRFKQLPKAIRKLLKEQESTVEVDSLESISANTINNGKCSEEVTQEAENLDANGTLSTRNTATQTYGNQTPYNDIKCSGKGKKIIKEIADHQYYIADTPKKLKARLDKSTDRIILLKKKLKSSQQKTRRLQSRVKSQKALIKCLRGNYQQLAKSCTAMQSYIYASSFADGSKVQKHG